MGFCVLPPRWDNGLIKKTKKQANKNRAKQNKMKNIKYHTGGTAPNFNPRIVEIGNIVISTCNIQLRLHFCSLLYDYQMISLYNL
jgi:hypothetical protein